MHEINQLAAAEHWKLGEVIDNGTSKVYLRIFGIGISDLQAHRHVLSRAKAASKLHIQAIQAVMQSRMPPAPKPKPSRKKK
jgi:ornithine cyclodeaminase/alanine dehydrogenase-like protein (mu-crystallin family)